jgi:hypothetical protein
MLTADIHHLTGMDALVREACPAGDHLQETPQTAQ